MTVETTPLEVKLTYTDVEVTNRKLLELAETGKDAEAMATRLASAQKEYHARLREGASASLESVRQSLRTEEERIRESYARRRAIIMENSSGAEKWGMIGRLDAQQEQQLASIGEAERRAQEARQALEESVARRRADIAQKEADSKRRTQQQEVEDVRKSLMTEEELIRSNYAKRRAIIDQNTSGVEKWSLVGKLDAQQSAQLKDVAARTAEHAKQMEEQKRKAHEATDGVHHLKEKLREVGSEYVSFAGKMAVGFVGLEAVKKVLEGTVEALVEYEQLQKQLEGITGSAKDAKEAFAALEEISDKTMSTEGQMTNAFLELARSGLDPSSKALKAYSDLAAGTGNSLQTVVATAVDASLGFTRAFKALNMRAVAVEEGEKLRITFRGITTTIGNNSKEIQDYLIKIGETQFAGAAERQLRTMGGVIKESKDAWEKFYRAIGESPVGDAIKNSMVLAMGGVEKFTAFLNWVSKNTPKEVESGIGGAFAKASDAAAIATGVMHGDVSSLLALLAKAKGESDKVGGGHGEDNSKRIEEAGQHAKDILAKQGADQQAILDDQNRVKLDELKRDLRTQREVLDDDYHKKMEVIRKGTIGNATEQQALEAKLAKETRKKLLQIAKEDDKRTEELRQVTAEVDPLSKIAVEYEHRQKIIDRYVAHGTQKHQELTSNNLATFARETDAFLESQNTQLDSVEGTLKSEEDSTRESYEKRRRIIDANVEEPEKRERLQAALKVQLNKQLADIQENLIKEREALDEELLTEEEKLRRSYERRQREVANSQVDMSAGSPFEDTSKGDLRNKYKERYNEQLQYLRESKRIEAAELGSAYMNEYQLLEVAQAKTKQSYVKALQDKLITTERYHALVLALDRQTAKKREAIDLEIAQQSAQNAEILFGQLTTAAKNWGGQQSGVYRTMFATQKAFAIAAGTLNMFQDISNASATPYPGNIPLMIKAAADGAAILAQLSSISFSGAYDSGGHIPSGKVGIVGEKGLELVGGPADVVGRRDTEELLRGVRGGASSPSPVNFWITPNSFDSGYIHAAVHAWLGSPQGQRSVMDVVRKNHREVRAYGGRS